VTGAALPATTAGASAAVSKAAGMLVAGNRCPHLLSPLRIRNRVLKNRIVHSVSPTYLLQGPETFPTDAYRNHYSNMAKNAAIVTINSHYGKYPRTYDSNTDYSKMGYHFSCDTWQDTPLVNNYVQRMIEDIHCENALVRYAGSTGAFSGRGPQWAEGPEGAHLYNSVAEAQAATAGYAWAAGKTAQAGEGRPAAKATKDIIAEAKEAEDKGYDIYELYSNSLEVAQEVKAATNLILMTSLRVGSGGPRSGAAPTGTGASELKWDYPNASFDVADGLKTPGVTNVNQPSDAEIQQAVEQAKKLEGIVDFVFIRDSRYEHPNSFVQDQDRPFSLGYAEAIKKAGIKILTCPGAGFHDPVQNDEFIAKGLMDMVGMTTPLFADPEMVEKIAAGKADDVVPCIQCQDCHGISSVKGPYYGLCNVNPKWAAPVYKLQNIHAPKAKKNVAVIGGGPAGMKAALVAAERGHKVTLYEKDESLGGLQKFSDYSQWRWNHKVFKDFLIHQVNKAGIEIKLNTTATPEMIKAGKYDTVLVAVGAESVGFKLPGTSAGHVYSILTCYSDKSALGKNVVMIGAGRFGSEAAAGMVKDGHKVFAITSEKDLIEADCIGPHNMMNQKRILVNHPDYNCALEATVKDISGGKVTYVDSKGVEKSVQADSIVNYAGMKAKMDEAEKFIGSADQVLLLGDCTGTNGNLQKSIRSAFFVASQV
jgi:thioredoxin reductase